MDPRSVNTFLALVLVQVAHSVEEYATGLYEVFAPARLASGLVSDDLATGFLVLNAVLVCFGLWCWAGPVRSGWASARLWMWLWIAIEIGNGITHPGIAAIRGGYFPGVITAPVLLVLALRLAFLLTRRPVSREGLGG